MTQLPSAQQVNSAKLAERIAWVIFLAVALRLLLVHQLGTVFMVLLGVGCMCYAYSVLGRRPS